MDTLSARLTYQPRELQFGTSGRRGQVSISRRWRSTSMFAPELEYLRLPAG